MEREPQGAEQKAAVRNAGVWIIGATLLSVVIVATALIAFSVGCRDDGTGLHPVCAMARTSPPWLLLSGLAAAPPVLLTWYWRTIQRERDLKHRADELEHRDRELTQRESELKAAEKAAAMTRLFEAVEKCESQLRLVRNLGIFVMRDVADSNAGLRGPAVASITAFVRRYAAISDDPDPDSIPPEPVLPEVQTALTILGQMKIEGVDLRHVDLCYAELRGAFVAADLYGSVLYKARLEGDFSRANLTAAGGMELEASGVNFTGATLERARLHKAVFKSAAFANANMFWAQFPESDFSGADLSAARELDEAGLEGAYYNADTKFPTGFDPTKAKMTMKT
jgi:uncharacterized protein YjbI with pentapeptide repeats